MLLVVAQLGETHLPQPHLRLVDRHLALPGFLGAQSFAKTRDSGSAGGILVSGNTADIPTTDRGFPLSSYYVGWCPAPRDARPATADRFADSVGFHILPWWATARGVRMERLCLRAPPATLQRALGGGCCRTDVGSVASAVILHPETGILLQPPFLGPTADDYPCWDTPGLDVHEHRGSVFAAILGHAMFNWSNFVFPALGVDEAGLILFGLYFLVVIVIVAFYGPRTLSRGPQSPASGPAVR